MVDKKKAVCKTARRAHSQKHTNVTDKNGKNVTLKLWHKFDLYIEPLDKCDMDMKQIRHIWHM